MIRKRHGSMKSQNFYTYILTNKNNTVLYIGCTNNLERRLSEHIMGIGSNFTKKYQLYKLIYYETYSFMADAIAREKQIKGWMRSKKVALIEAINPNWNNLNCHPERSEGSKNTIDSSLRSE